jgi:hypothetical protein
MPNASGSDTPGSQNCKYYRVVMVDLATLSERIQSSIKLLEQAISADLPRNNPSVHDAVFILDDVTPCYVKASAALRACHIGLSEALQLMQGTPASNPGVDRLARGHGGPADRT